ncbi:MAG: EAL domain-containing protein [Thioalkalispiraceae bacterium]
MKTNALYSYIHKQILVLMALSLFPGLGYILLGWINDIYLPALYWYLAVVVISIWGYRLFRVFDLQTMSEAQLGSWYQGTAVFFYLFFLLWATIFVLYAPETESGMHYIAVFTEIGAATVAATILFPDKKLYRATIITLIVPLVVYFFLLGTWYGYVLTVFACIFGWVLLYAANGSNELFSQTIFQSTHDFLTGLYNRQYIIEALQKKMNTLKEQNSCSYLLLIDLDHFKTVNDSLGHDVGDALLQEVVHRIQKTLPENTMISRLGGDEFIITGENFSDKPECKSQALKISQELLYVLKVAYKVNKHHIYLSASIGVSIIEPSGVNAVDFIKEADIAMYEVKAQGRDGIFFFDETMAEQVEYNLKLEQLLHFAVEKKQIRLVYQPQFNDSNEITGVEVLARWSSDELGEVSPAEFIPIAEKTGLIIELGKQIMEMAFMTLAGWHGKGLDNIQVSVNISMRQFTHYNFINDVTELCHQYLDRNTVSKVTFEITESVVAEDINKVINIIEEIKKLGIRFSMDDFGTGYSSLSYIRQLPIDELKIDRHFVKDLSRDASAEEMVNTILHMARIFNLSVVAEGVETEEQHRFLLEHGCKTFQGYRFSKPVPETVLIERYLAPK